MHWLPAYAFLSQGVNAQERRLEWEVRRRDMLARRVGREGRAGRGVEIDTGRGWRGGEREGREWGGPGAVYTQGVQKRTSGWAGVPRVAVLPLPVSAGHTRQGALLHAACRPVPLMARCPVWPGCSPPLPSPNARWLAASRCRC